MREKAPRQSIELSPKEVVLYDKSPLSSSFVETFIYEPTAQAEKAFGTLIIVTQVYSSRKRRENAALITGIAETLRDEYYHNLNREPIRSFKLALRRTEAMLREKSSWRLSTLKINLVVSVVSPPNFFLAQLGEGVVYLLRDRALHPIEVRGKRLLENSVHDRSFEATTEGLIRLDDILILSTKEIYKINPETLRRLVETGKLEGFLYDREKEFRNLALVTITLSPASQTVPTIQRQPRPMQRFSDLGKKLPFSRPRVFKGRPLTIGLIAALVIVLTVAALAAQKKNESAEKRSLELVGQSQVLEERIVDLIELENYQEAETALKQWEEKLGELASLGVLDRERRGLEVDFKEAEILVKRFEQISVKTVVDLEGNAIGFEPEGLGGDNAIIYLFSGDVLYTHVLASNDGGFTVLPSLGSKEGFRVRDLAAVSSDPRRALLLGNSTVASYTSEFSPILTHSNLQQVGKIYIFQDAFYLLGPDAIWQAELREPALKKWSQGTLFSQSEDFAIDGFIYVLEGEKIHKLLNGERNSEFIVESGVEKIFTGSELENLYLLNPHEGHIVVVDKLGGVSRRLQNEELKGALDFIVGQDEKTLWFLKNQRVFSISIPL